MDAILYAEVYFICLIIAGLLLFWTVRKEIMSTEELWLERVLLCFALNFFSNFLFTLFNRVYVLPGAVTVLSYALKTLYFISLVIGVFSWCGYAETMLHSKVFEKSTPRALLALPLGVGLLIPVVNLFTHHMFDFSEAYAYRRHVMFHVEMWLLFLASSACCAGRGFPERCFAA